MNASRPPNVASVAGHRCLDEVAPHLRGVLHVIVGWIVPRAATT